MAESTHLDWFRERLAASLAVEPNDPAPILDWRNTRRSLIRYKSRLIGLDHVRDWSRDVGGNIRHREGQLFDLEGARIEAGGLREVSSWDQPILTQSQQGFLGMLARERPESGVQFLLQTVAECGNIDVLQIGPSVQHTLADRGNRSPIMEVFTATTDVRIVYRANHTEEGSRFWKRSNQNVVAFLDDQRIIEPHISMFYWASLSQIKELALIDNVLSPFVKTILLPL